MRFLSLSIEGAYLVEPERHEDDRGFFARTWCTEEFADQGLCHAFVQESISFNTVAGTLRGMHYQAESHGEIKLVRCTAGSIYDVIVDLREGSPSWLKWHGET